MCPLSLSDIYKLEYEDQGIGDYRWIHPKAIVGFDKKNARALAMQRDLGEGDYENSAEAEFEETPDTLITDYLAKCLERRNACLKNGIPLSRHLNVTPLEYVDAILYLITDLGSSYACHILGATHFHDDNFLSSQDARPILERLRIALQTTTDKRISNLVRDLILEIFHLGYPWTSNVPRFDEVLMGEEKAFLASLLKEKPSAA